MTDTTFVDFQAPAVNAAWLNDVNNLVYKGIAGSSGVIPVTPAQVLTALGGASTADLVAYETALAGSSGSSQVGFQQSGVGAVTRTTQTKVREIQISVKDFGAVGDGVSDDTTAFQAAIIAAGIGRSVFVPKGIYKITSQLALLQSQKLVGESTLAAFKANLYLQLSTINVFVGQGATTTPAVLLDLGSGVHGICFNHPNQVAPATATPIQFGWTIATDTSKAYTLDDVTIRDVMFVNAYMGINLDNSGRFNVDNVSGQSIAEGLRVDRMLDVGRLRNVHFWTFTYTPGTAMYTWIQANGRAFNFNRCDDLKAYGLFEFGHNVAFDFNDAGNGAFWGDFVSCTSDTANIPVRVTKIVSLSWQGGTLIPNIPGPCITTSADVSETAQGSPRVEFAHVRYHTNAKCAAVITSTTGNFTFTAGDYESSEVTIINTSTAQVSVTDPKTRFGASGRLTVFGDGANTRFNGVPNPTLSTDVTPSGFNMQTFTAGVPNGWVFLAGAAANISNQGSGFVRLLFNSASTSVLSFVLPAAITQRRSLYTMRVLMRYNGIADAVVTFYARRSDTTNVQSFRRFAAFNHGQTWFYDIPLVVGYDTSAQSIDIEWSSPTGGGGNTGYLEIAGLQLFECADSVMQQDVIDSTMRREFLDPFATGPSISKAGSNREIQQSLNPPSAGTWKVNDRSKRYPQVVGQPKAWVCTVAGSPGTWVSEGNL